MVGGGPAGALLAYLLASREVPVTLVERHADFAREFRGEGLVPGGQKMFQQAGLWDKFLSLPHTVFERAELHFKGKPFAAFRLDWHERLAPRFVSQPAMLEMLVREASAYPTFTFRRGVSVARPLTENGRVSGVELTNGESREFLHADHVFACDGRFSALRKAAGLDRPRRPEAFDVVWLKIPLPSFYRNQAVTVREVLAVVTLGSLSHRMTTGFRSAGSCRRTATRGFERWASKGGWRRLPVMSPMTWPPTFALMSLTRPTHFSWTSSVTATTNGQCQECCCLETRPIQCRPWERRESTSRFGTPWSRRICSSPRFETTPPPRGSTRPPRLFETSGGGK